ncbi:hypothetical protein [Georgenia yuyongxinii]|uniref:Uncharacterized protein n=1 Tax=Georgenia yuyongxinii TaxID=2589797 RepID=A0A552WVW6_9MICO|nr:hypothetical protein [Georgenia yuyongxinii]TRW46980.1 hypothetical protein FJ693_03090 [Georgenia yuyongxinii]
MSERSRLDRSLAEPHHLLVLGEDVAPEDVEALAVSRSERAGWSGAAELQLMPGVHLTGPWGLEADVLRSFDLPPWARQAYLLHCPVQRAGALPAELRGVDPLLDAFPGGVPTGVEAEALGHLRAIARRLRGALRLAGTGAVVVPDVEAAVDLTVLAPVWLDHDAGLQVLRQTLPAVRSALDDIPQELAGKELEGYMLVSDLGDGDLLEVEAAGLDEVPVVLRGTDWAAGGVVGYQIRWRPAHPEQAFRGRPPLQVRRSRARAAGLIERAAHALQVLVGGEVVDDDGFLVDPGDLAG